MLNINPMLICDTYKTIHKDVYPANMVEMDSYLVPRKSMFEKQDKVVFFGLQAFLKELKESFDKNFFGKPLSEILNSYRRYMNVQLGEGVFNTDQIEELHRAGYLPIFVEALPEGSYVNMGVPVVHVRATKPEFAWFAQWTECWLQGAMWKPCNHATIGAMYHRLAKYWYEKNTDNADPYMAASDFGMRGMSCMEEAQRCSAAWLLSFNKTSTIPALPFIDENYYADVSYNHIGVGAVSIEHSVISSRVAAGETEKDILLSLLERYKNTSFSYVADTYDYWNVIDNILPEIKDKIMEHNGVLLPRPDSGQQVEITVETVKHLWNTFGGTENKKGYKVLDKHVRLILGDGCTLKCVEQIWKQLDKAGFAANNVVFGVGAFCFSAIFEGDKMIVNTRDTFGFAQKTTHITVRKDDEDSEDSVTFSNGDVNITFSKGNGITTRRDVELKVSKDPKTDTDKLKKTHVGLVFVEKTEDGYKATDGFDNNTYEEYAKTHTSAMKTVFLYGKLVNEQTFMEIRNRLAQEVK